MTTMMLFPFIRKRYQKVDTLGTKMHQVCIGTCLKIHMDVSKNSGTPKSSILTRFSIINHPFWGTLIFGNTHMYIYRLLLHLLFIVTLWVSAGDPAEFGALIHLQHRWVHGYT